MTTENKVDTQTKEKILALLKAEQLETAKTELISACQQYPKDFEAWFLLASVNGRLLNYQEVIDSCQQVINLNPNYSVALSYMGNAYVGLGRHDEAIKQYEKALSINPQDASTMVNLGNAMFMAGRIDGAVNQFQKAIQLRDGYAEAYYNLGNALTAQGHRDEAIKNYREAVKLAPTFIDAKIRLGNLLRAQGNLDDSLSLFQDALRLNPNHSEAHASLGLTLLERGNIDPAAHYFQKAIALQPESDNLYLWLARTNRMQGRLDDALTNYRKVQQLRPELIAPYSGEADILQRMGKLDAAYQIVRTQIDTHRADIDSIIVYTKLCHKMGDCEEANRLLLGVMNSKNAVQRDHIMGHYALGHLFDKQSNYDKAFKHFKQANDLTHYPFDRGNQAAQINQLIEVYSPSAFNDLARSTVNSELPVFIVGMPRSGTSLIEQILASHPEVFGAGELNDMNDLIAALPLVQELQGPYPECIKTFTTNVANNIANQFIQRLRTFSSDAQRITDKMPHNFMHLGLIALLFPNARIIHCTRDPLDTCLSIYFQSFSGGLSFASDLGNLGFYYRQYQKLMSHWKKVLPIKILDINYEQTVANLEENSKQMVDFIGLDWDPCCLDFHKTSRTIATASYDQVRKPLYNKSVERWKNYEQFIGPLKSALEEQGYH